MSEENQAVDQQQQKFTIQRIYLKDVSLEVPMGAESFAIETQPFMNQDLSTVINNIADSVFEVVLKLTITAKVEDETVFLIEVHQAGLFVLEGIEQDKINFVLNTVCLQVLLPYAREVIDNTLIKATFPPLMLSPINFEALYAQALEESQAKSH